MNRLIPLAAIMAGTLLLAGCPLKQRWLDVTDKHRDEVTEDHDVNECYVELHQSEWSEHMSQDEVAQKWQLLKACMAAKGWEPISGKTSN